MNHSYNAIEIENNQRNRSKPTVFVPVGGESPSKPSELEMLDEMAGLHARIEIQLPGTESKIIQFLGSIEKEGTSTIAREFARISAIKFNKTVLIIDGDMSRASQLQFFGIKPQWGLEDAYCEDGDFKRAVHQIPGARLFVSAIRKPSSSNRESAGALKNPDLWKTLRKYFDLIVVDSPAAKTSSEGFTTSPKADGVVLVLEAEKTRWPVAENTKKEVLKNGGKLLGIVLNKKRHYIPEQIYNKL